MSDVPAAFDREPIVHEPQVLQDPPPADDRDEGDEGDDGDDDNLAASLTHILGLSKRLLAEPDVSANIKETVSQVLATVGPIAPVFGIDPDEVPPAELPRLDGLVCPVCENRRTVPGRLGFGRVPCGECS